MKTGWLKRTAALAMSAFMAVTMVPVSALSVEAEERNAETGNASVFQTDGRGAVHDYGKSGDDPATEADESAVVANDDPLKSAQYQESTKYDLKANGTSVSVYKYQKQSGTGKFYHMDVARFSSDDSQPVFEVTMKDGTAIESAIVYPERYYPQENLRISEDKKTLTFQMSEGLRYCIVNINGTENDRNGKPQLAIINDPTETGKPDINGKNVLNFKEFSDNYLKEHPIKDQIGEKCREAGQVTDTSANDSVEYTWNYGDGVYEDYWAGKVKFPNKRVRPANDVSDAFQAALEEVKKNSTLDTIYFPAGTYIWSGLSIKNWDGDGKDGALNIYVDEDALMVNRIQECQEAMEPAIGIWNSSNITVSGRGIFDGQGTCCKTIDEAHARLSGHQGGSMVVQSRNITFNDTYLRDAKQWNWECHTGENITYNNIKGLSPFQHSWVDGLDLTSGKNITVNGAITMGNDDTFASGHYNPSDGFPVGEISQSKLDLSNPDGIDQAEKNIMAAAGIYNKNRLQWDTKDSENFSINNTLGWSTFANAVRLGHNTRWKEDGGSYQMKNYEFNNVNTLHVQGWSPNLGGGALSIQNGTNHCNPNYESLIFNDCSFTATAGNNSARFPNTNDLNNYNPDQVVLKNCWFKDATTPVAFKKINHVRVEDLYLGGELVRYTSQLDLTVGNDVGEFVFLADGKPVVENKLPVITSPGSTIQAYAGNPLVFYVYAEDPDGDNVTINAADVSAMNEASFDTANGEFKWTPAEEDIGKSYNITFSVQDYTGKPVSQTVRIQVGSSKNSAEGYQVAEDAHLATWKAEKNQNFGTTRYLTCHLTGSHGNMNENLTNTSTGDTADAKVTYLKFNLAEIKKQKDLFDKAELALTYIIKRDNKFADVDETVRVSVVEDSNWSETGITWNTKPTLTAENAVESAPFKLGTAAQDKPAGDNQAINGAKAVADITGFVNAAIESGKEELTLAVCETIGAEIYFVSREGADGFKNATSDMAPSILLNIPTPVDIEGITELTVMEGYKAVKTNSFALKGNGPFQVEVTCEKGSGKITWDEATQQIGIAEGLTAGTYPISVKVTNSENQSKTVVVTLTVKTDKSELQALYNANQNKTEGEYTEASWKTFHDALTAAKEVLDKADATQTEVEEAKAALQAALEGLEKPAPGDKTELQTLYNANADKTAEKYTETSWRTFHDALTAAKTILDKAGATQAEIDAAKSTLKAAADALKETGDRARLNAAIALAEKETEADYSELKNTWAEMRDALAKAKEVAQNGDAEKKAVDEASDLLEQKLADLKERNEVKKSGESTLLRTAIEDAEARKESDYTASSWSVMKTKLDEARSVKESETATLQQVTAAREALREAISGLVPVDKTGLNAAIAFAEGENGKENVYTAKSWDALQKALKEAKEAAADREILQEAVDKKTSELRKALRELEERTSVLKVALRNAIARENELKGEAYYTAASWAELQAALKNAKEVEADAAKSQDEVNEATAALREAFEKLKVSDKTGLKAAIEHAQQLEESAYTENPEGWAAMQAALAEAIAMRDEQPDAAQADIDEATRKLYAAVFDLDPGTINKNGLNVAINRANGLSDKQDNYRASSWAALQEALQKANEVSQKEEATQEEVIAATVALREALRNLENVDKSGLNAAIERAKELKEEDYKDKADKWKIMTDELKAAEKIAADPEAVQTDVDAATYQLSESIRQLEAKTTIDKEELKTAIERTKALDKNAYTEKSWTALEKALEDADKVLVGEKVTQEEVDAATKALRDAMIALEGSNKTGLNTIIDYADNVNEEEYTAESWAAMQEALNAVKEVSANPNATQQQINDASTRLSEALQKLEKLEKKAANKDVLRAKYNEAKAIKPDGYTAESYAALTKALEAAKAVLDKENATQAEVHAQTQALDDAVKGLKKAAASTVQTVIKVSRIKISGISGKIAAGKKIQLKAVISPSNAANKKVIWKSSNPKIATVNSKGLVKIKSKAGGRSVTITATAADGSGKKASYKIKIMKGVVKKIAISGKKSVKAGRKLQLKAKVTAAKNASKKLKWTSSNTKYAKVNSKGKVTALKAGKGKKVTITAMATDGSGKKKTVTIRIK